MQPKPTPKIGDDRQRYLRPRGSRYAKGSARGLLHHHMGHSPEDVQLIPEKSFSKLLQGRRGHPEHAAPMLEELWGKMNTGGFSTALTCDLKRFNGGLFREAKALPLSEVQLSLLIQAASHNWREVEPAIFGTLLERALDKRQRHKLVVRSERRT